MRAMFLFVSLITASLPSQARILHLSLETIPQCSVFVSQSSDVNHRASERIHQSTRFLATALKDQRAFLSALLKRIALEEKVPPRLLESVVFVESGFYPWVLNVEGKSYFFNSQKKAEDFLASVFQKGVTNIDIGFSQINWHWHGHHFKSPSELLSPEASLRYAAKLLRTHALRTCSWLKAALLYHSGDPGRQQQYLQKLVGYLFHHRDGRNQRAEFISRNAEGYRNG